MSNKKQIAINMTAQTVSFLITVLVSFFLTSFIVEKIGAAVYGFVGLANNVTNYVTIFTVAINSLANRYITISYAQGDINSANKYFTSVTVANIIMVAVTSALAVLLLVNLEHVVNIPAGYVGDVKILWSFVFLLFCIQLICGRMEIATFATNRLDLSAMRTMESNILKVVILVALYVFFEPKVWYIGVSSLICGLYIILANKHYMKTLVPDIKFSKKLFDFSAVKELLSTGIWNSANQLSQMLFNGLDLLIANLFIGASDMGVLSIAKTPPLHIIAFIGMIAGVFYPGMTVSYAGGDTKEFIKETKFAIRTCGLICSVPIVGIMVYGKAFYSLWLPSLPESEISLIQTLSVLTLLPQFFSIYIFPLYQVNTITCKLRLPSVVNIVLGVVNVALVYVLLKFTNLGLYAIAGVSSVLLSLRILIFVPIYAASNIKEKWTTFFPPLMRGIVLNCVLIALFALIKTIVLKNGMLSFLVAVGISGIVGYAAAFLVLFNRSDASRLSSILKKRKK